MEGKGKIALVTGASSGMEQDATLSDWEKEWTARILGLSSPGPEH